MEPATVKERLTPIFQDVFDDSSLVLRDDMTAGDVDAWDSLTHIDLIVAVERKFKVKFSTGEVRNLSNVGDFVTLISRKAA